MSGKSRLFYNGIPLIKYCRDNCINFSTIKSSICKKRKDIKFSDYTEQEIVDMVISTYGTQIKYMYDDIPLRQYCKENDINYRTIKSRISYLKKDYPDLNNDELVNIAIGKRTIDKKTESRNYKNKNWRYKYFYSGIPLKKVLYTKQY